MPSSGGAERALAAVVDRVADGSGAVAHVRGRGGSGRTWSLELVRTSASARGLRVVVARGGRDDPFGGLASLLAPLIDSAGPQEQTTLAPILGLERATVSPTAVHAAAARVITAAAATRPLVLLVDDVDDLDADSCGALDVVARRCGDHPVAIVTAGAGPPPIRVPAIQVVELAPLDDDALTALLVDRGLATTPARQCATAAGGNPGLAIALADGLTDGQRRGREPVAVTPRPAGALADRLRARLLDHGDTVVRALVVAAIEPTRDVAAVRAALTALGEPPSGLDDAEQAGIVDVVDGRVLFRDPWSALVAPHLVAPASRRAAHRALAAWFARPDEGPARAWHLAAAADGPNDAVADALELVARDTAARGALRSAAATCERAADFATTPGRRVDLLLAALDVAVAGQDVPAVRHLAERIASGAAVVEHAEARHALDEAAEFLDGPNARRGNGPPDGDGPWAARRRRRRAVLEALDRGDHRGVFEVVDRPERDPLGGGVSLAAAWRLRGDVRRSRALLTTGPTWPDVHADDLPYGAWIATLLAAELDVLQGRGPDALDAVIRVSARLPAALQAVADVIAARARLQCDPLSPPEAHPDAFEPIGSGPLREIRDQVAVGVLEGDPSALHRAIALADAARLPVEAAEARVWLLSVDTTHVDRRALGAATGALHRCGVRAWDARLAAPDAAVVTTPATVVVDPAVAGLSAAERRVADAVAGGMSNRDAAAALLVSVKTVDFHLQQIYRKLGIRSRTELAIRMMHAPPITPLPPAPKGPT